MSIFERIPMIYLCKLSSVKYVYLNTGSVDVQIDLCVVGAIVGHWTFLFENRFERLLQSSYAPMLYTRYWYKWDSLNGTLDKIGHGTWDNVYWVTKNEGTGMALKTMGH